MGKLFVNSIEYTIRKGGILAGKPVIEVRLVGCNLKCGRCPKIKLCDPRNPLFKREVYSEKGLVKEINYLSSLNNCHTVVFSGGEPFLQLIKAKRLFSDLSNYFIEIQTNGTIGFDKIRTELGSTISFKNLILTVKPKFKFNARVEKERDIFRFHYLSWVRVFYVFQVSTMEEVDRVKSFVDSERIPYGIVFIEPWVYCPATKESDYIKIYTFAKNSGFRVSFI